MKEYGLLCLISCSIHINLAVQYGTPLVRGPLAPLSAAEKSIYVVDGIQLPRGTVTAFQVYYDTERGKRASFRLQIYRDVPGTTKFEKKLIGQTLVPARDVPSNFAGIRKIALAPNEYIKIEQNDKMAILNEEPDMSISYQIDKSSQYKMRFAKYSNSTPAVNDIIQFHAIIQPEAFAVAINIDPTVSSTPASTTSPTIVMVTVTPTSAVKAQVVHVGVTGLPGPIGKKGDQGLRGEKGDTGNTGEKGSTGEKGTKGEVGLGGSAGSKGDKGVQGLVGVIGPQGAYGYTGETGSTGFQGNRGSKGDRGQIGPKGSQGDVGIGGQDGITGAKGNIGPRGNRGFRGQTGPYGATGVIGRNGYTGGTGVRGSNGVTGALGLTGPIGPPGPAFVDIDECPIAGCSHGCVNTLGSYYCTCNDGYVTQTANNKICVDSNECLIRNGNCQHTCTNTAGSYHCNCRTGFKVSPDRVTCQDVDECKLNDGGCADDEKCINTPGSKRCIPKVVETTAASQTSKTAAQTSCEVGNGLLSRMTIIGFIVWLIILSILIIIIIGCLFLRRTKRKDDYTYRDDASRRYSEAWEDQRSHKSVPFSSRLPEVNYY